MSRRRFSRAWRAFHDIPGPLVGLGLSSAAIAAALNASSAPDGAALSGLDASDFGPSVKFFWPPRLRPGRRGGLSGSSVDEGLGGSGVKGLADGGAVTGLRLARGSGVTLISWRNRSDWGGGRGGQGAVNRGGAFRPHGEERSLQTKKHRKQVHFKDCAI